MIEMTATDLRKDLFRVLDRMVETGEPLRVRRKGKVITFDARIALDAEEEKRAARFDAYMALGPREDCEDLDIAQSDSSHVDYDPEKKFKDIDW